MSPSSTDAGSFDGSSHERGTRGWGAQGAREGRARAGFLGAAARLPPVLCRPPLARPRAPPRPLQLAPALSAAPPALWTCISRGPFPSVTPRPPLPHHPEICQPPHTRTCSAARLATPGPPCRPPSLPRAVPPCLGECWMAREGTGLEAASRSPQGKGAKAGEREAPHFP